MYIVSFIPAMTVPVCLFLLGLVWKKSPLPYRSYGNFMEK